MNRSIGQSFALFAAGAALFALGFAASLKLGSQDPLFCLVLLTPLFGLPYLVLGARARLRTALYVLLLLPASHFAAIWAAMYIVASQNASGYAGGAAGGAIGAFLSFVTLAALRLARPRPLATMAAGLVVLALLGAIGVEKIDGYGLLVSLYLPWQLAFAFLLARLLRPPEQTDPV